MMLVQLGLDEKPHLGFRIEPLFCQAREARALFSRLRRSLRASCWLHSIVRPRQICECKRIVWVVAHRNFSDPLPGSASLAKCDLSQLT